MRISEPLTKITDSPSFLADTPEELAICSISAYGYGTQITVATAAVPLEGVTVQLIVAPSAAATHVAPAVCGAYVNLVSRGVCMMVSSVVLAHGVADEYATPFAEFALRAP